MRRFFPASAALVLAGFALSHAYLVNSSPAENALLRTPPAEVRLGFTEGVELRLSVFKVYALEAPQNALRDPRRLQELARPLVDRVLPLRDDMSRAERMDVGLKNEGRTAENVTISLKPDLKPGAYVVMWRVLSVDTHTTSGFFVFVYQPQRG